MIAWGKDYERQRALVFRLLENDGVTEYYGETVAPTVAPTVARYYSNPYSQPVRIQVL